MSTIEARILSGGDPRRGVVATIEVAGPRVAAQAAEPGRLTLARGEQFRAVPLLSFVTLEEHELLAVGQVRVFRQGSATRLHVLVRHVWRAALVDGGEPQGWQSDAGEEQHAELAAALVAMFDTSGYDVPASPAYAAVLVAKSAAGRARGSLADLRDRRYQLEQRLGRHLRREPEVGKLEVLLADVVELSIAAGRARDEARAAVRSGLWMWRNDDAAYHAHRRLLDPTLVSRPGAAEAQRKPWFAQYDAGVRQCVNLERQAGEEAEALRQLLDAGSTIAVARDASAQETFNLVATVGAVALGLPALVLALYSASDLLPFRQPGRFIALVPLLIAGLLSAVLAAYLPGDLPPRRRFGYAIGAVAVTLAVLATAGALVDPKH